MTSSGKNPSDPLSGSGTTQMKGTSQTQSGAEATQEEGEHLTERARRKTGELAGDLKRQAEDSATDMRQRARSAVDEQKETAIGGIEGVAHALRSASDDLRKQGQLLAAEYSRQVAARQRPVAFIGGAMVAGFGLARFMKSSSHGAIGAPGPTAATGALRLMVEWGVPAREPGPAPARRRQAPRGPRHRAAGPPAARSGTPEASAPWGGAGRGHDRHARGRNRRQAGCGQRAGGGRLSPQRARGRLMQQTDDRSLKEPRRTVESLRQDAHIVKEQVR